MTVYAKVSNNQIEGVYDLLPTNWEDILNFDVKCKFDEEVMIEAGFVRIIRDTTEFDSITQKMSDWPTYTVEDGKVYEHRAIEEIVIDTNPPAPPIQITTSSIPVSS